MASDDTIFALSSGSPPCAIAIIRISGKQAFAAVHLLAGRTPLARQASLATLRDSSGAVLDQALLLLFPGPGSATGEDLAELHVHGGRAVVRSIEAALAAIPGLRQAEAGEFTKRAFLNGRIDLNEAEGLSDLLTAETEHQRRAAASMFGGVFSRQIENWRLELLRISALTEAELDFSDEDDVDIGRIIDITMACGALLIDVENVLGLPAAEKLRDGLRIVLGGPPNSGKSTLLNALASREAAIVSDIAGTTRDLIEVPISFEGIPIILTDTAGVHDDSDDQIEAIGIERARLAFTGADMILWLGPMGDGPAHPALIEIDAKSDQADRTKKAGDAIQISAISGEGMTDLIDAIANCAKTMLPPADSFAVNKRQRHLLQETAEQLRGAKESQDLLITGEHLRLARVSLDALTGRAHTEDLLDNIFGAFCIGK
jgi:tRNA modification GTPase